MKRILFLTSCMSFGGAEKMLCFVADSLAHRGYPVCILDLRRFDNAADYERAVDSRIKVYRMDEGKKDRHISIMKEILSIAKKEETDVFIGFTELPNFYAALAGKILRRPSIISERGDPARTGVGVGFKNKIVFEVINRSAGGVFQTDGAKEYYGKGLQQRGTVIPNPIFINEELPEVDYAEREKTVVSVGRLENRQKRIDVMLAAFRLFHERHPDYLLKLYGAGPDEDEIRQWTVDLHIADSVRFMGLTRHPMLDIVKDGMFLITSDYEGISNSLLEAMAAGLPCVSTDHTPGGARLLIQDHENGLLAPAGDVKRIASAMCEFADDPVLAQTCGLNAMDVVNRFDSNKIIDMWEHYICKIAG